MVKASVQYFRNGNPITNPSVNSLSGFAYFYTKGIDGLPRVSVKRLEALLRELGVEDPRSSDYEVVLPNGVTIGAKVGALAPHVGKSANGDRKRRSEMTQAENDAADAAAQTQAQATLERYEAAKAEAKALTAWEKADESSRGERPATPNLDVMNGEYAKRQEAESAAARRAKDPDEQRTAAKKAQGTRKGAPKSEPAPPPTKATAAKKAPAKKAAPTKAQGARKGSGPSKLAPQPKCGTAKRTAPVRRSA